MSSRRECPKCNLTFEDGPSFCSKCGAKTRGSKEREMIIAFIEAEQNFFYKQNALLKTNLQKFHRILIQYNAISKRKDRIFGRWNYYGVEFADRQICVSVSSGHAEKFVLHNDMVCTRTGYGGDRKYTPTTYEKYNNHFGTLQKANSELTDFFEWLESKTETLTRQARED